MWLALKIIFFPVWLLWWLFKTSVKLGLTLIAAIAVLTVLSYVLR